MALDIALVNMPFASTARPSAQLGALHAAVEAAGLCARTFNLNVEFLKFLLGRSEGRPLQAALVDLVTSAEAALDAEHSRIFELAPIITDDVAASLDASRPAMTDEQRAVAALGKTEVAAFLEHAADLIMEHRPRAVGFTCTFARLPQLQLARVLKERRPELVVVFGGTFVEGVMGDGLARAFPFIDVVVRGEGEDALVKLLRDLRTGRVERQPGLIVRRIAGDPRLEVTAEGAPARQRLTGPFPNYDDYFAEIRGTPIEDREDLEVPIETSRGCWWFKHKCKFCGRSESNLLFRLKETERVVAELEHLSARHHKTKFFCVDPCVQERLLGSVIETARRRGYDFQFWCQGRVFTDKTSHERLAGYVPVIFLGIESLSTPVLELMRKGTTAFDAILAIRRGFEAGVRPTYNLIYDIPGEREEHYLRLNELLPSLFHLPPPFHLIPMGVDRASVYFDEHDAYGIELRLSPDEDPVVAAVHARGADSMSLAWDLSATARGRYPRVSSAVIGRTRELVDAWKRAFARDAGLLWYERGPGHVVVHDHRGGAESASARYTLAAPQDEIFLACEGGATIDEVMASLGASVDALERDDVAEFLESLVDARVMYREGDRYLVLAVRGGPGVTRVVTLRPDDGPARDRPRRPLKLITTSEIERSAIVAPKAT